MSPDPTFGPVYDPTNPTFLLPRYGRGSNSSVARKCSTSLDSPAKIRRTRSIFRPVSTLANTPRSRSRWRSPASLSSPGYPFTPSGPGETITLYGFGFGLPSTALVDVETVHPHAAGIDIGNASHFVASTFRNRRLSTVLCFALCGD